MSPLAMARRVADAILWEGYVLYPYRASSAKNQCRFQFGVVMPKGQGEAWCHQTEVVVTGPDPTEQVHVRFLQLQSRLPQAADGQVVPHVDGIMAWDEAVERSLVFRFVDGDHPFSIEGGEDIEIVSGGRIVRTRWPIRGLLRMRTQNLDGARRLTLRVENDNPWTAPAGTPNEARNLALRQAMLGLHSLWTTAGAFISSLEPPPEFEAAVATCHNEGTFPVLVGRPGERSTMLSSPILLYDYPAVAAQSEVSFHDGTEIDEMLTLRVMTLTDDEKREAACTDPRALDIVARSDAASAESLERLHGIMRPVEFDGEAPEVATLVIGDEVVCKGTQVRLRPKRSADPMDMFLAGREAEVVGVYRDLEGQAYVGVSVGEDWHGRPYFFYPDEVETMERRPIP